MSEIATIGLDIAKNVFQGLSHYRLLLVNRAKPSAAGDAFTTT